MPLPSLSRAGLVAAALMFAALPGTAATVLTSIDNGRMERSVMTTGADAGTTLAHDPNDQGRMFINGIAQPGMSFNSAGYFIFDLRGFAGTATTAMLDLSLDSLQLFLGGEYTIDFYSVTAPASSFDSLYFESDRSSLSGIASPLGTGEALFTDLTSGPQAGQIRATSGGPASVLLTTDGLDTLNDAVGSLLVLGFDTSGAAGVSTINGETLMIEGLATIPGPASGLLLLSGIVAVPIYSRYAKRKAAAT